MVMSPDQAERRRLLFTPCATREELRAWVYLHLELDLPGVIVDQKSINPSTTSPLDMLWLMYARLMYPRGGEDDPAEMLFYASREGGKTLIVSVFEVLGMIHVGTNVVHLAALKEQAYDAQKYLKAFMSKPDLQGMVVGDAIERTTLFFYRRRDAAGVPLYLKEWKALSEAERGEYVLTTRVADIVAATVRATNGKHVGITVLDEVDIIQDKRIIGEARNIPSPIRHEDGTFTDPLTVYISTRKTAFGPVQRAIDEAPETGLVVHHFNILDVTERCPTTRHRPDLPRLQVYRSEETLRTVDPSTWESFDPKTKSRYVQDEAYTGCMTNCKIFAACKGQLSTRPEVGLDSYLVKPLSHVVKKLVGQGIDYVKSQLLCYNPSSTGLIYGHLFLPEHFLTPAQVYAKITGRAPDGPMNKVQLIEYVKTLDVTFGGGQDYGTRHAFAFAVGFKFGIWGFVLRGLAAAELDIGQKIDFAAPLKHMNPRVWGDTAQPDHITEFQRAGWRMQDWTKGAGSVDAGIDIVKFKLRPPGDAAPELFFVVDEEDDEMVAYVQVLKEHAWKLDTSGRPTNAPAEEGKDHADGLRYWVMNEFPVLQKGLRMAGLAPKQAPRPLTQADVTTPTGAHLEMQEVMRGLLGAGVTPQQPGRAGSPGSRGRLRFLA